MDDETDWRRQLLVGFAVLVIVALLVGGIVGIIAIKAANVAGIGSTPSSDDGKVTFPTVTSTKSTDQPTTPAGPTGSTPPTQTSQPPDSGITLAASPAQAGTYQRVNLTGTYPGAAPGTSVQVQRREGAAWVDFPTSATVSGGRFATYIETGHTGPNRFRVFDAGASMASNVVVVQIG